MSEAYARPARARDAGAERQVLIDLVGTPSVSGEERAAAEVFVRHAGALGLGAEIDEAGNALAHRGPGAGVAAAHIVLLGHIDTVPGHIPIRIVDGVLHGRGSVDAKGPLAAMLCAAAAADLPRGVRVTVAGAVGEETAGSPGARFLGVQLRSDACIVGEPSGWDGVTMGYKGRLLATATATQAAAHSAAGAASAPDRVLAWWSSVLGLVAERNRGAVGVFETIQATMQRLSSQADGLTSTATAEAGFRLPLGVKPGALAAELAGLAPEGVTVCCAGAEAAYATDRNDPVVRSLSAAIRAGGATPRPQRKHGTADRNVVAPIWRCPIAAYGPGDSALDHTPEERLSLDEYDRSIGVLVCALETLARELMEGAVPAAPHSVAAPYPRERSLT